MLLEAKIVHGIGVLASQAKFLVIVTNEVFSDGTPADPAMQAYLQNLGNINCALGAEADVVAECCAGLPVIWKGESLYHEIMAGIFADRTFHV